MTEVNGEKKGSVFFDWGAVTTYTPDLRSHELVARVKWFISMRWLAISACAVGLVAIVLDVVPASIEPLYFGATVGFLSVSNLVYTVIGRNLFGDKARQQELRILLVVQMMVDFFALSFLTYSLGSIETPIATLFMAHIILATLFFSRLTALAIAGAAWLFASLPLVLEWAGVVPVLSIFDSQFKAVASADYKITFGFVLASGGVYFFCWYLVSEISRSLKLRELQVEEAYRMMVEMDKEKTQSTHRATHELKAPFAAIKSYVYTLRDGYCGPLPDKAEKVVTRIGDRCDHLSEKITDIIHLSNLRTLVVTDMNLAPVDLVAVLSEEAEEGALLGKPRGVEVRNLAADHPPVHIMGSHAHLKTLFSNLVRNGVQYAADDHGLVEISLETRARGVDVTIRDNGIGIPEESFDNIFVEHFRSKNAVAHHANGTGLGLPIVKEIARLHGASITVTSTVGKGSSFEVSFDVVEAHQGGDYGEHTDNR
jgi:signal transduction histidine kinase